MNIGINAWELATAAIFKTLNNYNKILEITKSTMLTEIEKEVIAMKQFIYLFLYQHPPYNHTI